MQTSNYFRNAVILGLITAVGPFGVDMYLPALPDIGTDLSSAPNVVILSLTSYFIAFGVFQIVFGTLSDIYGRKAPLYAGIGLFIAATIGCALATDITTLVILRFLQGVGGAAGIIIPRAIVRDMYSGVDEVKMMSLLMLVFSVSPLLAPLCGSLLVGDFGWRSVFWVLVLLGAMGLGLLAFFVRETWPKERRIKPNIAEMKRAYATLFADRAFMGMTFIGAFAITGFFIYLGNSSFVLSTHYGLSPMQYSLAFSANAAAFFAAMQLNGILSAKFGMKNLLIPAATGFAAVMSFLAVLFAMGIDSFAVMAVLLFIGFSFVGILLPNIMVLALEDHGDIAGTAASLMNTVQMVIGSVVIGITGALNNGTPMPMIGGIAIAALLTLGVSVWTFGKRAQTA